MAAQVIPRIAFLQTIGAALCIIGLIFTLWARYTLAGNWSGNVTFKENHELIRTGPYQIVRHPIYTGLLASLVGTVLLQGEVRSFLGFAIILFALYRKAKREEKFLSEEFGDGFAEHAKHTGMFLPRFS